MLSVLQYSKYGADQLFQFNSCNFLNVCLTTKESGKRTMAILWFSKHKKFKILFVCVCVSFPKEKEDKDVCPPCVGWAISQKYFPGFYLCITHRMNVEGNLPSSGFSCLWKMWWHKFVSEFIQLCLSICRFVFLYIYSM